MQIFHLLYFILISDTQIIHICLLFVKKWGIQQQEIMYPKASQPQYPAPWSYTINPSQMNVNGHNERGLLQNTTNNSFNLSISRVSYANASERPSYEQEQSGMSSTSHQTRSSKFFSIFKPNPNNNEESQLQPDSSMMLKDLQGLIDEADKMQETSIINDSSSRPESNILTRSQLFMSAFEESRPATLLSVSLSQEHIDQKQQSQPEEILFPHISDSTLPISVMLPNQQADAHLLPQAVAPADRKQTSQRVEQVPHFSQPQMWHQGNQKQEQEQEQEKVLIDEQQDQQQHQEQQQDDGGPRKGKSERSSQNESFQDNNEEGWGGDDQYEDQYSYYDSNEEYWLQPADQSDYGSQIEYADDEDGNMEYIDDGDSDGYYDDDIQSY